MKLRIVPASRGLHWVRQGLSSCRRQPLGYVGLLGMVACAGMLMMSLPVLGPLLVAGAMPVIWMGFMLATRRVLAGQRITPAVLTEPLRGKDNPRKAWAQLGGAYVMATLVVMQLAHWLGPGSDVLAEALESAKQASDVVHNPQVQQDLLWRMALTIPVSLLFWHTPAMVLWARLPVGKALFFSAVATWRNLGAFLVFGLGWLGLMFVLALIDNLVLSLIPEPWLANALAVGAAMWLAAAFYASLYFTVVDCFEPQQAEPTALAD